MPKELPNPFTDPVTDLPLTLYYDESPREPSVFSFAGNSARLIRTIRHDWRYQWYFHVAMLGRPRLINQDGFAEGKPVAGNFTSTDLIPAISRSIPAIFDQYGITSNQNSDEDAETDGSPVPLIKTRLVPTDIDQSVGYGPCGSQDVKDYWPTGWKSSDEPNIKIPVDLYKYSVTKYSYTTPSFPIKSDEEEAVRGFVYRPSADIRWNTPVGDLLINPWNTQTQALDESQCARYITKIQQPSVQVLRLPVGIYKWAETLNKGWCGSSGRTGRNARQHWNVPNVEQC